MPIGNWLAGVGGAATGAGNAVRFYDDLDQKKQLKEADLANREQIQELKNMVQFYMESGRNKRDATHEDFLRWKAELDDAAKNNDREIRANEAVARMTHLGAQDSLASDKFNLSKQQWNDKLGEFWDGTLPQLYDRNRVTAQGQQTRSGDSRYGADSRAASSGYAADSRAASSAYATDSRAATSGAAAAGAAAHSRARDVLDLLKVKQRSSDLGSKDNTDWSAEFDRLYNDPAALAGEAVSRLGTGGDGTTAAPVVAAPGAISPAARPLTPRGAPVPFGRGGAAPAQRPTSKNVTRDQVRRAAAKMGISDDEAAKQAATEGYTVVP